MANSVWKTLGIKKTSDIGAIKRAYAAKLKVTRPDVDPVAFQALRQEREEAEFWARNGGRSDDEEPDGPSTQDDVGGEGIEESDNTPVEDLQSRDKVEESTNGGAASAGEKRRAHTSEPPDEVLAGWLEGHVAQPVLPEIRRMVFSLRELSFEAREEAERRLLEAISANFRYRTGQDSETEYTPPTDSIAEETILDLSDEFGWFDNDRRLAELTYWEHDALADQLRNLKNYGSVVHRPPAFNPIAQWSGYNKHIWTLVGIAIGILILVARSRP